MEKLTAGFQWLSGKMMFIGAILLLAMVALTLCDVIGRMFGHPVFGAYELMSFAAALIAAAALPDTHFEKRHIGVELITSKLKRKHRLMLELITNLFALIICIITGWQIFGLAKKVRASGEVSMNLGAPEYVVIALVGAGFALLVVAIAITLVNTFIRLNKKESP